MKKIVNLSRYKLMDILITGHINRNNNHSLIPNICIKILYLEIQY